MLEVLAALSPLHGVRLLTHAEYRTLVGDETYGLHCVTNFNQWWE